MKQYQVPREEAVKFAQVWRSKGGLVGTIQDTHVDFACDFANIVLRNFVEMCKQQVTAAQPAPEAPVKKLIVEA